MAFNNLPEDLVTRTMNDYKYGLRFRMCMRELKEKYFHYYRVSLNQTRSVRPSDFKLKQIEEKMHKLDRNNPNYCALHYAGWSKYNAIVTYARTCEAYYA